MSSRGWMSRRGFLKVGSLAAAAATGWSVGEEPKAVTPVFRTLGRTGMKVSVVGIGALKTAEPAIFQAAFDRGVNYVDTARVYLEGRSERIVGEALKGYRDKVYLATKVMPGAKEEMQTSLQESFEGLKVDYVDLLQLHRLKSADDVKSPVSRAVLAEAKKQGRARFLGVSTHENEEEVINAVVDDPEKLYDTVLVQFNYKNGAKLKPAIARAAQAGVGIIAMKTQQGGYATKELGDVSPHQAALKWVLQDPNIACAVPGMVDLNQVIEDVAVMGMLQVTHADLEILERYARATAAFHCAQCGACRGMCPVGVHVPTINRSLMYAEGGYRDLGLARAAYREIPDAMSASACSDCAHCVARCPNGINIEARMRRARQLLA